MSRSEGGCKFSSTQYSTVQYRRLVRERKFASFPATCGLIVGCVIVNVNCVLFPTKQKEF